MSIVDGLKINDSPQIRIFIGPVLGGGGGADEKGEAGGGKWFVKSTSGCNRKGNDQLNWGNLGKGAFWNVLSV